MTIPHYKLELLLALLTLNRRNLDKKITDEKCSKLEAQFDLEFPKDKKELNQKLADSHGVTVVDIINSPNYQMLVRQYMEDLTFKLVKGLAKELEITEVEVWAIFAQARGLI